jgi:hypothetical protein
MSSSDPSPTSGGTRPDSVVPAPEPPTSPPELSPCSRRCAPRHRRLIPRTVPRPKSHRRRSRLPLRQPRPPLPVDAFPRSFAGQTCSALPQACCPALQPPRQHWLRIPQAVAPPRIFLPRPPRFRTLLGILATLARSWLRHPRPGRLRTLSPPVPSPVSPVAPGWCSGCSTSTPQGGSRGPHRPHWAPATRFSATSRNRPSASIRGSQGRRGEEGYGELYHARTAAGVGAISHQVARVPRLSGSSTRIRLGRLAAVENQG